MKKPDILVVGSGPIIPGMFAQIEKHEGPVIVINSKTTPKNVEDVFKGRRTGLSDMKGESYIIESVKQPYLLYDDHKTGKQRAQQSREQRNRSRLHYRK